MLKIYSVHSLYLKYFLFLLHMLYLKFIFIGYEFVYIVYNYKESENRIGIF